MALAHAGAALGIASGLGNAAGVRVRSHRCRNSRVAPDLKIARAAMLDRVDGVRALRRTALCIQRPPPIILNSICFNSPRSELHEKCPLLNDAWSFAWRSAGPCSRFLGSK